MKVELLVNTRYNGPKKAGDVVEVEEKVAAAWAQRRIAKIVGVTEDEEEEEADTVYSGMSAKELYEECENRGIEVAKKQPKAVYIEALLAYDARATEGDPE